MSERRTFTQQITLEDRLAYEAKKLREQAETMPHGPERDELIRKARQVETGSHMSECLRSPGLQSPKWTSIAPTRKEHDGRIRSSRAFVCGNDADAIVWAQQLVDC